MTAVFNPNKYPFLPSGNNPGLRPRDYHVNVIVENQFFRVLPKVPGPAQVAPPIPAQPTPPTEELNGISVTWRFS